MALRKARITTAAIPDATPVISMPGIIWLANKTANPVIPHRIKNPFMLASYRPCGHCLKRHNSQWNQKILGDNPAPASRLTNSGIGPSSPQCREKDCGEREVNKATHYAHQHFTNPEGHPQIKSQDAIIEANT